MAQERSRFIRRHPGNAAQTLDQSIVIAHGNAICLCQGLRHQRLVVDALTQNLKQAYRSGPGGQQGSVWLGPGLTADLLDERILGGFASDEESAKRGTSH